LATNNFQVSFVDPNVDGDNKLRPFRDLGATDHIFNVSGSIMAQFDFSVDVGVQPVVTRVFDLPIQSTDLLDFSQINPVNPLYNKPPVVPDSVDVVLNMNLDPDGNDGQTHFIEVQGTSDGNLQIIVDGQVRSQYTTDLVSLASVTIIGSSDQDVITVAGNLNRSVYVEGGDSGLDQLIIDDRVSAGAKNRPYIISSDEVQSGGTFVNYSNLDSSDPNSLIVYVAPTNANVIVASTSVPTLVDGGSGTVKHFVGGFDGGDLLDIRASLTLGGNLGTSTLIVNDVDDPYHTSSSLYPGELDWSAIIPVQFQVDGVTFFQRFAFQSAVINFSEINQLIFNGGSLGNAISVDDFETSFIDPSMRINLNTGGGNNQVTALTTTDILNVNGQGGTDTVTIGSPTNGTQGIGDSVFVSNAGGATTLNVDDSASQTNRAITIKVGSSQGTIQGLTPFYSGLFGATSINHKIGGISAINIYAGSGTNNFYVYNTAPNQHNLLGTVPVITSIWGGPVYNNVHVFGTTGELDLDMQNASNYVEVGSPARRNGPSVLDTILGLVRVNGAGSTFLTIDDSFTSSPQQYVLGADFFYRGILQQFATGAVDFENLYSLTVLGGSGGNIWTIVGTPSLPVPGGAMVKAGLGDNTLNATGTGGTTTIDLQTGAFQSINFGDATHSMDAIQGQVYVLGSGLIAASVDDEASTIGHWIYIGDQAQSQVVNRYAKQPDGTLALVTTIWFGPAAHLRGSIDYFTSSGGDFVEVDGNPVVSQVNVFGHQGATTEFGVDTGTNSIQGPVGFFGTPGDEDYAYYNDSTATTPRRYTATADPNNPGVEDITSTDAVRVAFGNLAEIIFVAADVGANSINVSSLVAGTFLNSPRAKRHCYLGQRGADFGRQVAEHLWIRRR
jgi:hypothetical protein